MASFFRRDGDSSNTVIGIILLVMLLVFVGPNIIPVLLSRTLPFIDEGVPCSFLQTASNRAQHQSLIGRSATNPLILRVESGSIPNDANDSLIIDIVVLNNTIGTVAIVYDPAQVIGVNDPNSSGLGLVINTGATLGLPTTRNNQGATSFPESSIRLLGPRQRCIHRVTVPFNSIDQSLRTGQAQVQAYYRITSAGTVQGSTNGRPVIFTDQGLAIFTGGVTISAPTTIPLRAQAN